VETLAQVLTWTIIGLVVGQGVLLIGYVRFLYKFRRPLLADNECPPAAAVLCVRGLDPFLAASVKGLLQQDYPDYEVYIVVDSVRDPAWPVVNTLAKQSKRGNVSVLTLTDRLPTTTRKISGVLQALGRIDASRKIVALLDGDTIPHASWLRELAGPLKDPRVGVASGNRWYMPARLTAGSLVRYLWNAAAVVQMYFYDTCWGGSLAFKTELLRETDLRQRLANAFGEDNATSHCARRHGYRVAFAPSLMMVNRETCDVGSLSGFLQRQLLSVRLHNHWWPAIVLHGFSTTVTPILCAAVSIAAAIFGNWAMAAWMAAAFAGYWASMVAMVLPLEWCSRRIVRARGEQVTGFGLAGWLRVALTIPLAQAVHFKATVSALFTRDHRWRGVRYRFNGLSPVQVIEDAAEAA
jgi:cellulose synthase/poly-beta-1,6-N-acetylglucosamine synthase-like glycosyltransferase